MTRILIVEDDRDIASLLCRGLGAAGYAADRAETVEAAVDRVEQGGVDAAIIDMMLGDESGAASASAALTLDATSTGSRASSS